MIIVARRLIKQPRTSLSGLHCIEGIQRWCFAPQLGARWAQFRKVQTVTPAQQEHGVKHLSLPRDDGMRKWAETFDPWLPQELRLQQKNYSKLAVEALDLVRFNAKTGRQEKGNPIAWMIINGHRKAGLWLLNAVQAILSKGIGPAPTSMPSNIIWKDDLFKTLSATPAKATVPAALLEKSQPLLAHVGEPSLHPSRNIVQSQADAERFIWRTVAELVLHSGNVNGKSTEARETMSAALLVISRFHEHGLMPDRVYDASIMTSSSYLQKAPILHLVSSRILAALSDASWREKQQDMIELSLARGKSLKDVAHSAPGGRFLLKVRPLGPEIWLELVLSTFVELGYYQDAAWLVQKLNSETPEEPWHAVRWCSHQHAAGLDVRIDWERLKARTGGTVGRIEGYSSEKPFVDVPSRTISVETVLATVDGLLMQSATEAPLTLLKQLFEFLEPHDLSSTYLDYLQTRPLHYGSYHSAESASALGTWCQMLDDVRAMEQVSKGSVQVQDLGLPSIWKNTLLPTALRHQQLHALIALDHIHTVLPLFNQIQEMVDINKLASIQSFMVAHNQVLDSAFFSTHVEPHRLEYVGSVGHLPRYILGALLRLITENKLYGLGDWLIFSNDADGPLISEPSFAASSLLRPLFEFAAASGNSGLEQTLKNILKKLEATKFLNVRLIRTIVNLQVASNQFSAAQVTLQLLKTSKGGGHSPANMAHLVAAVIRLEAGRFENQGRTNLRLLHASNLLHAMLGGTYDPVRSDFTRAQVFLHGTQFSHLLRLIHYVKSPTMAPHVRKHIGRFPTVNRPSLSPQLFNIVLDAVAETRGSHAARIMCYDLCAGSNPKPEPTAVIKEESNGFVDLDLEEGGIDSAASFGPAWHDVAVSTDGRDLTSEVSEHDELSSDTDTDLPGTIMNDPTVTAISDSEDPDRILHDSANQINEFTEDDNFEDPFFSRHLLRSLDLDVEHEDETEAISLPSLITDSVVSGPAHSDDYVRAGASPMEQLLDASRRGNREEYNDAYQMQAIQVTIPNVQTLRIVIRQAIAERVEKEGQTSSDAAGRDTLASDQYDTIKTWAIQQFKAFNITSPDILEQELEQPVTQLDIERARDTPQISAAPKAPKSEGISKLWRPRHNTRRLSRLNAGKTVYKPKKARTSR